MNVEQLAGQTDPRDCINFLLQNEPVINNPNVKQKYASQDPFAEEKRDLEMKELELIREAIVHAKCWQRLPPGVITQPYGLTRNHDGVLVFLTEAVPNLGNGKPATLYNLFEQYSYIVKEFVIKTLKHCKIMVEHGVNHCDLHLNNVMVMPNGTVRIIDFGYALIGGDKIPGGFYDNQSYNDIISSSKDACIFMRSIGLVLHNAFHPYLDMYDRIMRRYARECKTRMELFSSEELFGLQDVYKQPHKEAMLQLFKHGGLKKCRTLDYMLGRFTWQTMTPTALLEIHGINVTSI